MKTTKLITALLLPTLCVACSDDLFEGNTSNNPSANLVEDVTLNVGFGFEKVTTRGAFAGDESYIFKNFYFEPAWTSTEGEATVDPTTNSEIKGDQVGICLPNPVGGGNVLTNVPFYIAGYRSNGETPKLFELVSSNNFYDIEDAEVSVAFSTLADFNTALGEVKGATIAGNVADPTKGIFKTIGGIMTGKYILYYPYNKDFTDMAKVPVKELPTFQAQTVVDEEGTASTGHVAGANLFAYSKALFKVDGANKSTNELSALAPAAYFFQFRVFNTHTSVAKTIKLITVSTVDNAAAFAKKGVISASTEQATFVPDAETAVNVIGVGFTETEIASATAKEDAKYIYLSTYAVKEKLAGKDIVIKVYANDGTVGTINKSAAGSSIKEGGTDYWNIDLKDVTFSANEERLVYDNATLASELAGNAGTLKLMADVSLSDVTVGNAFIITGDHKLTIDGAVTLNGKMNFDCDVEINATKSITAGADVTFSTLTNKGTLTVGSGSEITVTATTIDNEGSITIAGDATLKATTINNKAVVSSATTIAVNGTMEATTLNNAAAKQSLLAGEVTITGAVANTTIENMGTLELAGEELPSTVTVNNSGTFETKTASLAKLYATVNNNGTFTMSNKVNVYGSIINAATITNEEICTLLGDATLLNSGIINANAIFNGLSRLTNQESGELNRTIEDVAAFTEAMNTPKVTGIVVGSVITSSAVINTDKKVILGANLILPVDKESTIGKIVFKTSGVSLTAKVKTDAINVIENGTIAATSYVTVNGNITVEKSKTLTVTSGAIVKCTDIKGEGTTNGDIYID